MKRSEINRALRGMEAMLEQHCFALSPFCHYIRLSKKACHCAPVRRLVAAIRFQNT